MQILAFFFLLVCLCGFVSAVMLSDYYDLLFNDILNCPKFAVILKEADVFQIKQILKAISSSKFRELHMNTIKVDI